MPYHYGDEREMDHYAGPHEFEGYADEPMGYYAGNAEGDFGYGYGPVGYYSQSVMPPDTVGYYAQPEYPGYGDYEPMGYYADEPPMGYGYFAQPEYPGYGDYEPVGYYADEYPFGDYADYEPMGYYADYEPMGYYAEPGYGDYEPMGYYAEPGYAEYEPMGYSAEPEMGYADDAYGYYGAPDMSGYVKAAAPTFNAGCPLPTNVAGWGDADDLHGYVKPTQVSPMVKEFTAPAPSPPPPEAFRPLWE
jgi:hypothetical protein